MKQDLISELSALDNQNSGEKRTIPPLENWQPAYCGEMDLVIKSNGDWIHDGRKMTRQSMIDLFAKVLWAEIDNANQIRYFLKTPVEKIGIQVEDAPLQIVNVEQVIENQQTFIKFTTSQGDCFYLDNFHQVRFGLPFRNVNYSQQSLEKQQSQPYILVRKNADSVLYALILRPVFYHLVNMGELVERADDVALILQSGGQSFSFTMSADTSIN